MVAGLIGVILNYQLTKVGDIEVPTGRRESWGKEVLTFASSYSSW